MQTAGRVAALSWRRASRRVTGWLPTQGASTSSTSGVRSVACTGNVVDSAGARSSGQARDDQRAQNLCSFIQQHKFIRGSKHSRTAAAARRCGLIAARAQQCEPPFAKAHQPASWTRWRRAAAFRGKSCRAGPPGNLSAAAKRAGARECRAERIPLQQTARTSSRRPARSSSPSPSRSANATT